MPEERDEILRLRDRVHALTTRVVSLELRQQILIEWRDQMTEVVNELRESDAIADAVSRRLQERRSFALSRAQTWAAIVAACVAACGLGVAAIVGVLDALAHFGVIG